MPTGSSTRSTPPSGSDDITVYRVRRGVDVLPALLEVDAELAILDLQIGNMGGMATCMTIRNEEGMGRLPITAVLMLLDRAADVFLAHRSDADGWLIKPLDAFRLRRAADALLDGGTWFEGVDEHELATGVAAVEADEPSERPPASTGARGRSSTERGEGWHPTTHWEPVGCGPRYASPVLTGCSAVWQRASFGTKRSWVQIPPARLITAGQ